MANIRVYQPRIYAPPGSNQPNVMKGGLPITAAQVWKAWTLVVATGAGAAQTLSRVIKAGTSVYGLAPQAEAGLTTPPGALFGATHYPFDLRGVILEINATNGTQDSTTIGASGVTWAGGGTNGVALLAGQRYGLNLQTSGTYSGIQTLDVQNTTAAQAMFEIIGLAPKHRTDNYQQLVTDANPRLLVKLVDNLLQA